MAELPWQVWLAIAWLMLVNIAGARDVRRDKRLAKQKGASRVPEAQLVRWAFLGGWPLMAATMASVRHKTRKTSFKQQFWLAAVLNLLLVGIFVWYRFR